MRHRRRLVIVLVAGLPLAGCGSSSSAEPPATRTERIERTATALSAVLVESAALAEAERLVDLCTALPDTMLSESIVWDPTGPKLFESVDAANSSGGGSARGILVAELACTPDAYLFMQDLQNI